MPKNPTKCLWRWELSWVYWCFPSHATIFQSYMWRHRCAGGLKKMYPRSGSQRHTHFARFWTCPYYTDTEPPFLYGDSDTPPQLVAFYDTLAIRRAYSRLKPRRPHGGMALGARPSVQLLQSACTFMCRHIYDWNIVDCDVVQIIQIHKKKVEGHVFQIHDYNRKVLFNTKHVQNMIVLSLTVKILGAMLKFFLSRSKVTIKFIW